MAEWRKGITKILRKIAPSTNHLLLAGVVILYVYSLLEGDSLPFFLLRSLEIVLVVAWLWSVLVFDGIKYGTEMEAERSQVGQVFPLNVRLANKLRIYIPWLEVKIDIPPEFELAYGRKGQVLSLGSRETRTYSYQLRCCKRGYYQLGAAKVRLGDVFGIFVRERELIAQRTMIVYPKIIALDRLNIPGLRNLGSSVTVKSSEEDLTGPTGVRKYAHGDPLNRIHWRATARTGQLQVKEYDLHTSPEVAIFLDLSGSAYTHKTDDVLEAAVTTAASIANFCFTKRMRYGLVSNGSSLFIQPPSRDVGQLLRTMEHLAVADIGWKYAFDKTVLLESRNFIQGTTIVLVTPQLDEKLTGILGILHQRGHSLAIAQVGHSNAVPEFAHSLTYFSGISEENLAQVLGGEAGGRRSQVAIN